MHSVRLLSLLRARTSWCCLCLYLIKSGKHVLLPLCFHFSSEFLSLVGLFFIIIEAVVIEGNVVVVVIVFALASNLSSFVLGVGLGGILHRLLSSALSLNNVVWINVTIRALIRLGLRLFLDFLLLRISFWVRFLLIFEVQLLLF